MKCDGCGSTYKALNQHTMCPQCGAVGTTEAEIDEEAELKRGKEQFAAWVKTTEEERRSAERRRDFYDGKQWTSEELSFLRDRSQPPTTNNHIGRKIDFLIGDEISNRVDPKALPRRDAFSDDAAAITDAIRYVCDDQKTDRMFSACYEEQLIEGVEAAIVEAEAIEEIITDDSAMMIGGDVGIAEQTTVTQDRIKITVKKIHYDRIWWDTHTREYDYSDATYLGMHQWMFVQDAIDYFATRADAVENYEEILRKTKESAFAGSEAHSDKPSTWVDGDDANLRIRIATRYYKKGSEWWVCIYTCSGFLVKPKKSSYKDEYGKSICPIVLSSAFVDRENRHYGVTERMMSPQEAINKRESKSLHLLSTRQIWAEEGAVIDETKAQTESKKPDGWVKLQPNALASGRIKIEATTDLASGQLQLLQESKQAIEQTGPSAAPLMEQSNSGRDLQLRMNVGAREIAKMRDAHKSLRVRVYEHIWWGIKQFMTEEAWMRVSDSNDKTGFRFVGINRRMTKGQRLLELAGKNVPMRSALEALSFDRSSVEGLMQEIDQMSAMLQQQTGVQDVAQLRQIVAQELSTMPAMQEAFTANDVAKLQMDIVLTEEPDTAVLQQEEYEKLVALFPAFLQAQINPQALLELAIEASSLRSKKKLIEIIKPKQDPQQAQVMQMMQQIQQALAQLQVQQAQANVQATQAKATLDQAKAANEGAEAALAVPRVQADIQGKHAEALHDAATAGKIAAGTV